MDIQFCNQLLKEYQLHNFSALYCTMYENYMFQDAYFATIPGFTW